MSEYLDDLTKERVGYVMRNEKNGVIIRCTEDFVKYWKTRGFEIIEAAPIRFMEE
ncbi:hypothetical protein DFP93_11383 [Aneurinibacillus soli]|uniref:Uncharacterized protein n=1 Tax=Aneurinibacillus soli TaxID=1500254 RepID=A0A0U4WEP9_9BACL|nr:hypothetical protein [Aneurinibacillus soli]PYE60373.1 hypothetical protein DFP93_11383 [Aneurinibacillus soli]BAU27227.1 hypothetical protein CB4_01396 [Aneurinibacillus soli]